MINFIKNNFHKIKFHDRNIKKYLAKNNIFHYLFTYDLLEYNFKDIYGSFNISYFTKEDNLLINEIDTKELQYYEKIENNNDNFISILIKKFKLRISIEKIDNFSKDIIISDFQDFDINNIVHTNSLIKIAIVKDNIDKWVKSGNLSDYNFIFTFNKDYLKLLKDYTNNVFFIEGETRYLQVKNILNLLYARKKEEFYNVINPKFRYVFPKMNNYFSILHSEFYDEEYYKIKYHIADNTDPIIHYLLVGYLKNYNPGPNFSTYEYYECNSDVKKRGIDPLSHYEKYGKKENRVISISEMNKRNYSLILNSPYFDMDWYIDNYNIKGDVDCVNHYLDIGYKKGFNPGPNFSTYEYYECNKDIKKTNVNPLFHYELKGKIENRVIKFSEELIKQHYLFISDSPYFDKEWYVDTYGISSDVDPARHYLDIGYARGFNPGPNFSTYEYYECHRDVKKYGMNPLLHYEQYGRNEGRKLHFSDEVNNQHYLFISDSPYFDKEWYVDTYGISSDVDPARHYLDIGYARGFNPGPNFSTYEYYECHNDVDIYGMNPLLHYEQYGRNEKRFISILEKKKYYYNLILNSPYFDKDWYESTYDIIEEEDSVNHYLYVGYIKRYNPGPDFSTQEYFECNRDVKEVLDNPLVHYERIGREENRKIHFSDERHQNDYDLILNSPYFDKDWYESTYDLTGFDDSVYHYLNIGYAKGFNPGPNFSTNEYYECNDDVKKYGMNPLLHYEQYGRQEGRNLSLKK